MKFLSILSSYGLLASYAAALAVPALDTNSLKAREVEPATGSVHQLEAREKKRIKVEDRRLERGDGAKIDIPEWFKDHADDLKSKKVTDGSQMILKYGVNKESLLVYNVITQGAKMDARDVYIDSFMAENGDDAKKLKYIGFDNVVEEGGKKAIKEAWKESTNKLRRLFGKKFEDGDDFICEPGKDDWKKLWEGNVLLKGIEKMISEDEYGDLMGEPKIKNVRVIVDKGGNTVHMTVTLDH